MKRLLVPILLVSQTFGSTLFEEYTSKFTNKRTSDARIGLLKEIDPHTAELTKILKIPDFSEFLSTLKYSNYAKVRRKKIAGMKRDIANVAEKLFTTDWIQPGNAIYPPDNAMTTLGGIKFDLLILEQRLPRFSLHSGPMMVQQTPIKGTMSLQEKMAYIQDLQNTSQDIFFRLIYKFQLVQKIFLKFSGDLCFQTHPLTRKRKESNNNIDGYQSFKRSLKVIPADKLSIPTQ